MPDSGLLFKNVRYINLAFVEMDYIIQFYNFHLIDSVTHLLIPDFDKQIIDSEKLYYIIDVYAMHKLMSVSEHLRYFFTFRK